MQLITHSKCIESLMKFTTVLDCLFLSESVIIMMGIHHFVKRGLKRSYKRSTEKSGEALSINILLCWKNVFSKMQHVFPPLFSQKINSFAFSWVVDLSWLYGLKWPREFINWCLVCVELKEFIHLCQQ